MISINEGIEASKLATFDDPHYKENLQKAHIYYPEISAEFSDFAYTGIICLILFMAIRLTNKHLWQKYTKIYNRPAPQILITLLNILVVLLAATFISIFIFKKSLLTLMTAGSVASLGFAFALQGPILDFFSGIVMDIEGRVKNGDWIRLQDNITVGQIIGHNWRSVTLLTMDGTDIVVPNSKFVQSQFENISREETFWQTIEITLDYNIPVQRAERLLIAAMSAANGVYKDNVCTFANKFSEGGIIYNCRYKITDYAESPLIRHNVMRYITEHLHYYKLGVSETLGEYVITNRKNIKPAWQKYDYKNIIKDILIKTPIIQELETHNLEFIEEQSIIKFFDAGANVCVQDETGDTMFIILEGFVDIYDIHKENEKEICVASLGTASYFGEMALFMGDKRRSTVRARSSLVLLEITRHTITQILSDNPQIVEKISKAMLLHLKKNQQFIDELQEKAPIPKPPLIKTIYTQILKILKNS